GVCAERQSAGVYPVSGAPSAGNPRPFAVAGIQMPVTTQGENIAVMARYAAHVRKRCPWFGILLFPELCVFGPNPALAQELPGDAEERLCRIAQQHRLWLIPGSLFERHGEHVYNTTPVIDPTGAVIARFRKLFPFRPYEQGVSAGREFVVFDVPGAGRFGVSVFSDM